MPKPKIAIIGATGNVGRRVISLILHNNLAKSDDLKLFASEKSKGQTLIIGDNQFIVDVAAKDSFKDCKICIFNTESDVSADLIPSALESGAYVVDSSSYYRLQNNIPLIIPPVNDRLITATQKLYAHANCLASPISVVLAPLHKAFGVKKVNIVTFQSTSGAGKAAMDECLKETQAILEGKSYNRQCFKRQIAFNVIPQVGEIFEDGSTFEEYKIIKEIQKVIDVEMQISATCVRVPVIIGHSIALSVETNHVIEIAAVEEMLKASRSIKIYGKDYLTPVEIVGSDDVHVGRIRRDSVQKNLIHLWLCSDNLMRGAAKDAVEIVAKILALV